MRHMHRGLFFLLATALAARGGDGPEAVSAILYVPGRGRRMGALRDRSGSTNIIYPCLGSLPG